MGKSESSVVTPSSTLGPVTVKGKILDEAGNPIPFVVVNIKGTQKNSLSDLDGNYTIAADEADTLSFSFLGYKTQLLPVSGRETIDVKLLSSSTVTDEVVVVGYGTSTRHELSSSIGSVDAKTLTSTPVADAAQALQGRVSGVTIVQNSGAPGGTGGTSIRIRGVTSITGNNNPLIVVDGFPLADQTSDNVLNAINPNEIESIDVLKDAAAASIYGVRGSNGVIIITTKRGKAGKTSVSLDVYRGLQQAWQLPSMLNARDYAIINTEARVASGSAPIGKLADPDALVASLKAQDPTNPNAGNGTNWLDQIFRRAAITSIALNASGGSDLAKYAVSAGYFKQDGIIRNTDFERYNIRFNGDLKATKRLTIGNSTTLTRTLEHSKDTYNPTESIVLLATEAPPTVKPRNVNGTYAGGDPNADAFNEQNPVYAIEVPQGDNTRYRAISTLFAEYEVIKGLTLRANLGIDLVFQRQHSFYPATAATGGRANAVTTVGENSSIYSSLLAEYTAAYKRTIGNHSFNGLGGYTAQENAYNTLSGTRFGYVRTDQPLLDAAPPLTSTGQVGVGGGFGTSLRLLSFVGRAGYDYLGKYIFSASVRRDGSSNFAPDHHYAVFPAASVAWNVMEEPWMRSVEVLNSLKVRGSFGQTGNQNVPNQFSFLSRINSGVAYPLGPSAGYGGLNQGSTITGIANSNLIWERNQQMNVGIDAAVFNNRLNVSLDLYQRKSIDLIFNVAPPELSGTYESVPYNTGTMVNNGIDLSLNGTVTGPKSPVVWNSTLILGTYTNKVSDLGAGAPILNAISRINGGGTRVDVGQAVNYFYGYKTEGIFQTNEEIAKHAVQQRGTNSANSTSPGDIKFVDTNGDGVIDDKDRVNLGNSLPTFTYGFTNTFKYGIVELSVFLQGSQGNKVVNVTKFIQQAGVSNENYSTAVLDRWVGPGTSNDVPRMIQADPNKNNRFSDRFVEDASYLRVKNIKLTISLPQNFAKAIAVSNMRVYGSVQNALTFTKYSGFDPEVGGGVDYGFYPQPRTVLFGFNMDF